MSDMKIIQSKNFEGEDWIKVAEMDDYVKQFIDGQWEVNKINFTSEMELDMKNRMAANNKSLKKHMRKFVLILLVGAALFLYYGMMLQHVFKILK